ncbi:MAG: hypothetical protein NT062_37475 [Proteobacteria bacterium]|nr:hypothetical protein [Pseudomonadota bacterium]
MPLAHRAVVIGTLLLAIAAPASADPAAEQLFRDARQLLKDGHVDEACRKFEQSQALEPKVGTLLNLGDCQERQGNLATAWEVFLRAKALASRQNDSRAAEAARRAEAVAPRRAFITLVVPRANRVPGLVIKRDATELPESLWDAAVPIDPGSHTIVATAPGHQAVTMTVEVGREAQATATLTALPVVTVSAAAAGEPALVEHPAGERGAPTRTGSVWPPLSTLGIGPLIGLSSDNDLVVGGRVIGGVALPHGALRGSFSVKYASFANDANDPENTSTLFAFGVGLDYLWMFHRGLATGGGLGAGVDRLKPVYENQAITSTWFALRASPIVLRFETPRLELGLHVELALPANVVIGLIGLDWFVW